MVVDRKQNMLNFVPALRSGEWSDIGGRPYMEDTHVCIGDLAKKYGYNVLNEEAISFYGVSQLTFCCLQQFTPWQCFMSFPLQIVVLNDVIAI